MALYELYRHDIQVYQDYASGDTRQSPASGIVVDVYKEGATANGDSTINALATGSITVFDPGAIAAGDEIQIETTSTATRTVDSVTDTTVVVLAGATAFSPTDGQRLVVITPRPDIFLNDQGAGAAVTDSEVTTDSTGQAYFYTKEPVVDLILDDGTTKVLKTDQVGAGGRTTYTPFTFGAKVDGSTDDSGALTDLETYLDAKGGGVIELPQGTMVLSNPVTISESNIAIRGSGRGVTVLQIAHTGIGITISGTDVTLEGVTFTRTAAGSVAAPQLKITGTRVALRNIHFKLDDANATTVGGISCLGDTDTRGENLWFTNTAGTWSSFIYMAGVVAGVQTCLRPHFSSVIARYVGNITAGIVVDGGTVSPRFDRLDVSPTTVTAAGGIAFQVKESLTLSNPTDIIVTSSRLSGGSDTGTAAAVSLSTLSGDLQCVGAEFIGVHCVDSSVGYHILNATNVKIIGGSTVGIRTHGIDIDGGSYIQIVEHLSSDCSSAANNTSDHVSIAAGVDDVYINGLIVGTMVRGNANEARYGVAIAAGVSDRVQIMGLRGAIAQLGTGWISNASTSQDIDISHNIEYGNARSYTHTAVPGAEAAGGYAGTKTLSATETTTSVLNVNTLIFNQSADTAWDFNASGNLLTNPRDGQIVTLVNISGGGFDPTFTEGATLQLSTSPLALAQYDSVTLMYSTTATAWIEIGKAAP